MTQTIKQMQDEIAEHLAAIKKLRAQIYERETPKIVRCFREKKDLASLCDSLGRRGSYARGVFKNIGIKTLDDLCSYKRRELKSPNLGYKTIDAITERLNSIGRNLAH